MPGLAVNRQLIKSRLFTLGSAATFTIPINGFSTWALTSRRLRLWNAVDSGQQPAMFLVQHRENRVATGTGNLIRRYLDMGFWCYAPTGDETVVGDDLLDIMESGLETMLQPDNPHTNELTLGGLVTWVRVVRDDGLLIRDPGDIDSQALLVLPVRILLP